MEAKGYPAPERKLAIESELATEWIVAAALSRDLEQGVVRTEDADLTAALIEQFLQDWYVKRAKYRERGTSIQRYVAGVVGFVERAVVEA